GPEPEHYLGSARRRRRPELPEHVIESVANGHDAATWWLSTLIWRAGRRSCGWSTKRPFSPHPRRGARRRRFCALWRLSTRACSDPVPARSRRCACGFHDDTTGGGAAGVEIGSIANISHAHAAGARAHVALRQLSGGAPSREAARCDCGLRLLSRGTEGRSEESGTARARVPVGADRGRCGGSGQACRSLVA